MDINFNANHQTNVEKFNNWTNSEENLFNALNGENVEEFQMFDFNAKTYSSDLKNFAQEYIDLYDKDGDGKWNKDEFIAMATNETEIPEKKKAEYETFFAESFKALNIDKEADSINAGEFATMLYAADVDWNNYAKTKDVVSSLDGKVNYDQYQGFSSMIEGDKQYETLKKEREDFYNTFYAE